MTILKKIIFLEKSDILPMKVIWIYICFCQIHAIRYAYHKRFKQLKILIKMTIKMATIRIPQDMLENVWIYAEDAA